MSSALRIGVAQFDVTWENRDNNIHQLESMLPFGEDIDLLLLPEMWSTGFSMQPEKIAEKHPGLAFEWMQKTSSKLNLSLAGSISIEEDGKYYNRFYVVHSDGSFQQYDKRHLFSYGKEDDHYTPGNTREVFDIKGWKIMPVICYDLRFPVWCRNNLNYDLMIIVANWPTPRIHHWDALIRARAIENQCYIAAVNRIGIDGNDLHYPGHSCIVDMNGNVMLDMKDKEGIGVLALEKELLEKYRTHFRFLQDQDHFHF